MESSPRPYLMELVCQETQELEVTGSFWFSRRGFLRRKSFGPLGHAGLSTKDNPAVLLPFFPSPGFLALPSTCSLAVQDAPGLHFAEPPHKAKMNRVGPKAQRFVRLGQAPHPQKPQPLLCLAEAQPWVENLGPTLWFIIKLSSETPGELGQMPTPHLEPTWCPCKALFLKLPLVTDDTPS